MRFRYIITRCINGLVWYYSSELNRTWTVKKAEAKQFKSQQDANFFSLNLPTSEILNIEKIKI